MINEEKIQQRIEEIKKLYDISEAEMVCLIQMQQIIRLLGYSSELQLKLLKTLCAIDEMVMDEVKIITRNND